MPHRLKGPLEDHPPLSTAIVGGGRGCASILEMVARDLLGRFRMRVVAVADRNPEAPGMKTAKEMGVPLLTSDIHQIVAIPGLDLIIELTGQMEVRDELERIRPRNVKLIDHFGASLFWEIYTSEKSIIQERTAMREQVETERQRIKQIFDSIPDEIVVVDTNMVVVNANASFIRNNGFSGLDEVTGRHCYELEQRVRGECQVAVEDCPFFTAMRSRTNTSLVRKHFDRMGRVRFAAIVAAPLVDIHGEVAGVIESTRDISHRILLEEELRATESRLQQFMELAPMAAFVKTTRGQYLEANPAGAALFGKPRHEILGRTDLEILPRKTAEVFRADDRRVLETQAPYQSEEEVMIGDRPHFLYSTRFPVLDANGHLSAVGCVLRDVTEQKATEAELSRTRAHLANVANHSPMIIVTLDMGGKILSFNRGAEDSLGYQAEELIGRSVTAFYPNLEERRTLQHRVVAEEAVRDFETELVRKDGSLVPVSMTTSKLKDADGQMVGTVTIAKDISRRRALMNQVLQSERMAAVGLLAAGVAHEINNPLAIISEIAGYLNELLQDDPQVDEQDTKAELEQGLPKITTQVQRCRTITRRLLSFARKSGTRVEITDVNRSIEEILPFIEREALHAQIRIQTDFDPELPAALIEEMQLQEIFINLILNAIQAVSSARENDGLIRLGTRRDGAKVVVTVEDNGPGIPPEVIDKIFDPFVTTKDPGKGTGLGLSICYAIAKRYQGEITVSSSPGKGASFQVILPQAPEGALASVGPDPAKASAAPRGRA